MQHAGVRILKQKKNGAARTYVFACLICLAPNPPFHQDMSSPP